MTKKDKLEEKKKKESLAEEVARKDWFNVIITDIEKTEEIYADPRIKGYIRDHHEKVIHTIIEEYILDEDSKDLAQIYFEQAKIDGERKRIKNVEKELKALEKIILKAEIPFTVKKRFILKAEEQINSQIPLESRTGFYEIIKEYYKKIGLKNDN